MDGALDELAQQLKDDDAPEPPAPPKRGRPRKAKLRAVESAPASAGPDPAAAAWGQFFILVNAGILGEMAPPAEISNAQGLALYEAIKLTWPEVSPVAMAWTNFGALTISAYVPYIIARATASEPAPSVQNAPLAK